MNDLVRIVARVRQQWWYMLVPALLLAGIPLVTQLQQPPLYAVSVEIMLTSRAPMNDTGDTLAYDFPAVSRGQDFVQRVADTLGNADVATVAATLDVRNADRVVSISARGSDTRQLVPIRDAALAVLARDGTLLWGKTSGDTGVNIMVLRQNDTPQRQSNTSAMVVTTMLRALAGALIGVLFALRPFR